MLRTPINTINSLLLSTDIWRASAADHLSRPGISSGFDILDRHLPGNGWPADGLTELLHHDWGIGEIRLIAPALAYLSQSQNRWIVLIGPPFIPYAPALYSQGIDLKKILVINPEHQKDKLWAMEKSLASQCCSAVLAWPEQYLEYLNPQYPAPQSPAPQYKEPRRKGLLKDKDIRRLQLACKNGNSWGIIFRPATVKKQASPAELRIHLQADHHNSNLCLHILKRRGGWATDIHLDLNGPVHIAER